MKPKAYVINLDRRSDRWQQASELWSPFFDLVRVSAVDLPGEGAKGCKQSHVNLAEELLKEREAILVLEDDAVPTKVFRARHAEFIRAAHDHRDEWDYINFGPVIDPQLTKRDAVLSPTRSRLFLRSTFSYRTHFVAYNRRSLPLLRESLNDVHEIDVFMGVKASNQWLPVHVLAVQSGDTSDIHKPGDANLHGYQNTEAMLAAAVPRPCVGRYLPAGQMERFYGIAKHGLPAVILSDSTEYDGAVRMMSPPAEGRDRDNMLFLTVCLVAARRNFTHLLYGDFADGAWDRYCDRGKYDAFSGEGPFVSEGVYPLEHLHQLIPFKDGGTVLKAKEILDYNTEIGAILYRRYGKDFQNYIVNTRALTSYPTVSEVAHL